MILTLKMNINLLVCPFRAHVHPDLKEWSVTSATFSHTDSALPTHRHITTTRTAIVSFLACQSWTRWGASKSSNRTWTCRKSHCLRHVAETVNCTGLTCHTAALYLHCIVSRHDYWQWTFSTGYKRYYLYFDRLTTPSVLKIGYKTACYWQNA